MVQKVNIAPDKSRKKAAAPSFDIFVAAIEKLNMKEGFSASIRQVGADLAHMPLSKPSKNWQWGYLDSAYKLRREVVIADIHIREQYYILIEFQQRETERYTVCLASAGKRRINNSDLYRLLFHCSTKNGIWKNIRNVGFDIVQLKHTWTNHTEFSSAVAEKIPMNN